MTHRHNVAMRRGRFQVARVRLSVDVDPELRRRVKVVAAARDQAVKEWIEVAVREALIREAREVKGYAPDDTVAGQDSAWLGSDLSRLGEFETYEWEEEELGRGSAGELRAGRRLRRGGWQAAWPRVMRSPASGWIYISVCCGYYIRGLCLIVSVDNTSRNRRRAC